MLKTSMKVALGAVMIALLAGTGANAATPWQKAHPRRTEVNHRLANQNRRLTTERREGDLTRAQAKDIRAEDRGIRGEERYDASHDKGHITKSEQRALNHQENSVSQQIGK